MACPWGRAASALACSTAKWQDHEHTLHRPTQPLPPLLRVPWAGSACNHVNRASPLNSQPPTDVDTFLLPLSDVQYVPVMGQIGRASWRGRSLGVGAGGCFKKA